MPKIVEYTYRKVERFIVTRYHSDETPTGGNVSGSEQFGEFDNASAAHYVAYNLAKAEDGATFIEPPPPINSSPQVSQTFAA